MDVRTIKNPKIEILKVFSFGDYWRVHYKYRYSGVMFTFYCDATVFDPIGAYKQFEIWATRTRKGVIVI